ncbi:hypothetical protein J2I47_20685 [Fibrella sp. HMF5335]|uniref:YD repeat-containing protein n=1 Tax=Fibrella rubiginis TaxID=2817060 RepID=A0A939GH02_9BACT|nr:hypothetical protein [Fibrella rubiginis]MBO0938982.1 hypothetical protein [Fibrella rubiginis]
MNREKQSLIDIQRVILFVCVIGLGSQCTQQTVDKKADGLCRIKMVDELETITEGAATLQTNTRRTTYAYTANGDLAQQLINYEQRDSKKVINTYSYDESYAYDAEGYAITQLSKSQWKTEYDSGEIIERTTYVYEAGRLSQSVRMVTAPNNSQAKITRQYNYDASGQLTQLLEQTTYPNLPDSLRKQTLYPDGYSTTWTYKDGKAADYVLKTSGIEKRPYTLQNGLITRAENDLSGSASVYTYDSQRRVIKDEYWQNGKLKYYTEYVPSAAKLTTQSLPVMKGFPIITNPNGERAAWASYKTYWRYDLNTSTFYLTSDAQTQYKLTGAGYTQLAETTDTQRNSYPVPPTPRIRKNTQTYTYDGACD